MIMTNCLLQREYRYIGPVKCVARSFHNRLLYLHRFWCHVTDVLALWTTEIYYLLASTLSLLPAVTVARLERGKL